MATLGAMRTRIADELQVDSTVYATEIDRAIYSAIEFYNDRDYWFLDTSPTSFVLSATTAYSLGTILSDRSQIKSITLLLSPIRDELIYRTFDEMRALDFSSSFTGEPQYWSIDNDTLHIWPRPGVTYSAEAYYSLRHSMTASASASSVWTNEAEELIRLTAEVDILENRIKDFDEAMRKRGRLMTVSENLDEKTVARRGLRRIKPFM